ncbi:DUF6584 family protein [Micromonospora ureilytica]|uniref:DUF6584 family protein n=1 Tax=Micromonospora ureilytica TaxID=709868 RepID=UPI002E0F5578|nr:hypothetical protein OHB55_16735 [Micromonospora ureilytica]
MAKEHVLARVAADLRRGHIHPAMQRLASLNAAYPDDLELRGRRAALYRQVGNRAEAGRWGFLGEDATAEEIVAFESAYGGACRRLLALKMTTDPTDSLGPAARERFARLIEQAGQEGRVTWAEAGPRPEGHDSWTDGLGCLLAWAIGLAVLALALIGLITVIRWAG